MNVLLFLCFCLAPLVTGLAPFVDVEYDTAGSIWVRVPQVGGERGVLSRAVWSPVDRNLSFSVPNVTRRWIRMEHHAGMWQPFEVVPSTEDAVFPLDAPWLWSAFSWLEFCPQRGKIYFHEEPLTEKSHHECGWGNETSLKACDTWDACDTGVGYVVFNGTHGNSFLEYTQTSDASWTLRVYLVLLFLAIGYWLVDPAKDLNLYRVRGFVATGSTSAMIVAYHIQSDTSSLLENHLYANLPAVRGWQAETGVVIHAGAVLCCVSTLVVVYLVKRDALYVRVFYEIGVVAAINMVLIRTNELTGIALLFTTSLHIISTLERVRDVVHLYRRAVEIFFTRRWNSSLSDIILITGSIVAIAAFVILGFLTTWEPVNRIFFPLHSWLVSACTYVILWVACATKVLDLNLGNLIKNVDI